MLTQGWLWWLENQKQGGFGRVNLYYPMMVRWWRGCAGGLLVCLAMLCFLVSHAIFGQHGCKWLAVVCRWRSATSRWDLFGPEELHTCFVRIRIWGLYSLLVDGSQPPLCNIIFIQLFLPTWWEIYPKMLDRNWRECWIESICWMDRRLLAFSRSSCLDHGDSSDFSLGGVGGSFERGEAVRRVGGDCWWSGASFECCGFGVVWLRSWWRQSRIQWESGWFGGDYRNHGGAS